MISAVGLTEKRRARSKVDLLYLYTYLFLSYTLPLLVPYTCVDSVWWPEAQVVCRHRFYRRQLSGLPR